MEFDVAQQIAGLLNSENQLDAQYTAQDILSSLENYIYKEDNGVVKGFIECKKVQWYQTELCHLTTNPDFRMQGISKVLIEKATLHAQSNLGARVIQCTIREGNIASERAFSSSGFKKVSVFNNHRTANNIQVWQKVVATSA